MDCAPSPRVELWQTLSRAFAVPSGTDYFFALREDLADDLDDLAHAIGLDLGSTLNELSRAVGSVPDDAALLVGYSRLFLAPPIPCRLTLGWHLDGTLMGPSQMYLRDLMAGHGVAQVETPGETPDALPTVLEFVALLFQWLDATQDAARRAALEGDLALLRAHYLCPTVGSMAQVTAQAENDCALPPLYSTLLKIIDAALEDPLERMFVPRTMERGAARPRYFARRAGSTEMASCTACGKPVATTRELRVVTHRLEQAGLPADHLSLCPDCRGVQMGGEPAALKSRLLAPSPGLQSP